MDECENCGITQEDYGAEFESCNGEMLCEDCAKKYLSEEEKELFNKLIGSSLE